MSKEYGFFGEMKLDGWNEDARSALRLLQNGDVDRAYSIACDIEHKYMKHRRWTDRWTWVTIIMFLFFAAVAVIIGLASGKWVVPIIIGVLGLMLVGFFNKKVLDKREAVDNAFYDTYNSLMNAINSCKRSR